MEKLLIYIFCLFFFHGQLISQEWTISYKSEGTTFIKATSHGNKAYFAGGKNCNGEMVNTVEVYDAEKDSWYSFDTLSVARKNPTAVTCGDKILFAGGFGVWGEELFGEVDIYDTNTREWTLEYLSLPRIVQAAASDGKKVLFAGGILFDGVTDIVDIYDSETGIWSTAKLSIPRGAIGCTVSGNKAYFAGGSLHNGVPSNRIDIYDFSLDEWSIDSLPTARTCLAAEAVGDLILFAGGAEHNNTASSGAVSDKVEIYNVVDKSWTEANLFRARAFTPNSCSAVVCDQVFFIGGGKLYIFTANWYSTFNTIDIYDAQTGEWSVDFMVSPRLNHEVCSVANKLLVTGNCGDMNSNSVHIYSCLTDTEIISRENISVYPNPAHDLFYIGTEDGIQIDRVMIYDLLGKPVLAIPNGFDRINISTLQAGIYLLEIHVDHHMVVQTLMIN